MEQKTTFYTYGKKGLMETELIPLLKAFGINCVVDTRPLYAPPYTTYATESKTKEILRANGIAYLPFYQHFHNEHPWMMDKRGRVIYEKVIQDEDFLQGIERLRNGLSKGFRIIIIDDVAHTPDSIRFTRIGRFFKETYPNQYNIIHIFENGHYFSQEALELRIAEDKTKKREKIRRAAQIGVTGEELAGLYLLQNGYQILDRNWNLHKGCEIDIVAIKDDKLHFVEVKTRSSIKYGEPQTAINYKKMRHIGKAIYEYRHRRYLMNKEYQIDSIAIIYRNEKDYDLTHYLGIRFDGGACAGVIRIYSPQH